MRLLFIAFLVRRVQGSLHTLVAAATAAGVPFERDGPGPNWDFSLFSDGEKVPVSFGGDRSSSSSETLTVHFCHISAGLFCPIRLIYSFGCLLDGVRHEIDSNQVIGCDASGPCGRWRRCEMRPVRLASTYTDIFLNGETGNVQI